LAGDGFAGWSADLWTASPLPLTSKDVSPLRVRGIERLRLHADLAILAMFACALVRERALPLAAYPHL
jgi:hypothetical protein